MKSLIAFFVLGLMVISQVNISLAAMDYGQTQSTGQAVTTSDPIVVESVETINNVDPGDAEHKEVLGYNPSSLPIEVIDSDADGSESLPIPKSIRKKADELIISKIGKDNYEFIKYELGKGYLDTYSICNDENPACLRYFLTYSFNVPEKDFINHWFTIEMDGHEHLIKYDRLPDCIQNVGRAGFGHEACVLSDDSLKLPACADNPDECTFEIDADKAKKIAKEAGLEEGVMPWRANFGFQDGTFVWYVHNTIFANSIGDESGKSLTIDANSGNVLDSRMWEEIHAPLPGVFPKVVEVKPGDDYDSGMGEVPVESGTIRVSKISPTTVLIKSGDLTANTQEKLLVEEEKLYIDSKKGKVEIKVFPEDVTKKVKEQEEVTAIDDVELKEENEKIVYSVKATKKSKLLGIVPVSLSIESSVNAETGNVEDVKKPWWSFLVW